MSKEALENVHLELASKEGTSSDKERSHVHSSGPLLQIWITVQFL